MRIGFDVSQTGPSKAGCGYFAEALIRQLAAEDKCNEYILYPTFGDNYWDPGWASGTCEIASPNFCRGLGHASLDEARAFWRQPSGDFEQKLGDPDIIHANNFYCPVGLQKAGLVYTLYDLAFLEHPEWTTEANRVACFTSVFNASLHADRIVAISEYSRRHFLATFPHYPEDHIRVVYPASRFALRSEGERPPRLPRQLLRGEFWLHVGTLEPRKNQKQLLQAYARLRSQDRNVFPLVLAGGAGWLMDDFEQTLRDLDLDETVFTLGYVDDETLQWLYENCFAFVYPSLFEGFGLPVLEAMTLGAPVITSNRTSLPEIVGDAGLLVDPVDCDQLVEAMLKLASDNAWHRKLGAKGQKRATRFSWRWAAREVLGVYGTLGTGFTR
jgi:glycosyltransferase involved in cell wall biosynthesis